MSTSEAPPLRFFEGFAWAIPTAFAGALAANRFEEGDVLFRDAVAYDAIETAIANESLAIQVLEPPKGARTSVSTPDAEGDRRRSAWLGEVQIELIDLASGEREARTLSQGKLITTLWQGDVSWLEPDREEPPLPRVARELAQALPEASAALDAVQKTKTGCRFVFVVDLASDASRVKAQTIEEALGALGPIERIDLTPLSAEIEAAATYHPALVIRSIALAGVAEADIEAALKKSLYGGGSDPGDDVATGAGEGEDAASPESAPGGESDGSDAPAPARTDRFSAARHGLLEAIGEVEG